MVSYDEEDRKAGWWNDIHCTHNKSRAFVCAYDNGLDPPDLLSVVRLLLVFQCCAQRTGTSSMEILSTVAIVEWKL